MTLFDPRKELAPHFKLSEFFVHRGSFDKESWDYLVSRPEKEKKAILDNLTKLAKELSHIRLRIGRALQITSGFRCPLVNRRVGGEDNSYHMKGMAADIVVPGLTAYKFRELLGPWRGGLGQYRTFTHLDIGPERSW